MAKELKTIVVKDKESGEDVRINEVDFNEDVHTKLSAKKQKEADEASDEGDKDEDGAGVSADEANVIPVNSVTGGRNPDADRFPPKGGSIDPNRTPANAKADVAVKPAVVAPNKDGGKKHEEVVAKTNDKNKAVGQGRPNTK